MEAAWRPVNDRGGKTVLAIAEDLEGYYLKSAQVTNSLAPCFANNSIIANRGARVNIILAEKFLIFTTLGCFSSPLLKKVARGSA